MVSRRRLLGCLGASISAVAGCLGSAGSSSSTTTSTAASTTTAATSLPVSSQVESLETTFSNWGAVEWVRYYDPKEEALKRHYPDNEWWVNVAIQVVNLGGSEVDAPGGDDFRLLCEGDRWAGTTDVPGVDDAQLRPRGNRDIFFCCLGGSAGDVIAPGEKYHIELLFDTARDESPVLVWLDGGDVRLRSRDGRVRV